MNILITGATGFVGKRVTEVLSTSSMFTPIAAIRSNSTGLPQNITSVQVDDLGPDNSWSLALKNVEVVIHMAARVHVMNESEKDPLSIFRKVNVDGTLNLARQASKEGVKRFIFISSIKVNGEGTVLGQPYTENDAPAPVDPYGISKYETEVGLNKLSNETGMEVVSIRPPLVYGAGVKANFLKMMTWLYKGIPLPFGNIHNKRSLVALDNLVSLIVTCIDHKNAGNQTFLVSDDFDLSTTELLEYVARAMRKRPYLLPIPEKILEFMLYVIGKGRLSQRLCGSLQVDINKAKDLLSWEPVVSVDDALYDTVKYYIEKKEN